MVWGGNFTVKHWGYKIIIVFVVFAAGIVTLVTKSMPDGLQRLPEQEKDGLVQVLQEVLVTVKGNPFIHNICMAFEARLWQQLPHSQLFSKAI